MFTRPFTKNKEKKKKKKEQKSIYLLKTNYVSMCSLSPFTTKSEKTEENRKGLQLTIQFSVYMEQTYAIHVRHINMKEGIKLMG